MKVLVVLVVPAQPQYLALLNPRRILSDHWVNRLKAHASTTHRSEAPTGGVPKLGFRYAHIPILGLSRNEVHCRAVCDRSNHPPRITANGHSGKSSIFEVEYA